MATGRKYEVADFRQAIEQVGASPAAIADHLGCARSTVYRYLKRIPTLSKAFEAAGGTREENPQYPLQVFLNAIPGSRGIKTAIVQRVGCARSTLDAAIKRWPELDVLMAAERASIVDLAESKLLQGVNDGDMRAILFTLETLGKERGWTKRTEVTGADGAALFDLSPETLEMLDELGADKTKLARQFEQMVQNYAMLKRSQKVDSQDGWKGSK